MIWECGLSLTGGAFKNGKKMRWMLDNKFVLTPFIESHFPLISKKMADIFNGQFLRLKVKEW